MENDNILTFLAVIFLAGFFIILPATALNTPSEVQAESIITGNITILAGTYEKTDKLELTIGSNKESKTIYELLNKCKNNECEEGKSYYSASGILTTTFAGANFTIGIPVPENSSILSDELSLKLTGNALEPELDLGNDGLDWIYPGTPGTNYLSQIGITNTEGQEELIITNCEKLATPKTTELNLNIYVKASAKPDITIFNEDNQVYSKECSTQPTNQYQWLTCNIKASDLTNNVQVFEGAYYFCISSPAEDRIKYTLQNESKQGYIHNQNGVTSISGDYLINIQPKEHNSYLTEATISISNQDGTPLISRLQEYINDCPSSAYNGEKYCIVPITVRTKDSSQLTLSSLNLNVLTKEGRGLPLTQFVTNLQKQESSKIILNENKTISLSLFSLKAPSQPENYNITAKINSFQESREILVKYKPTMQFEEIKNKFNTAYNNYQISAIKNIYADLGLDKKIESSKITIDNYDLNPDPGLETAIQGIAEKIPETITIKDMTAIKPYLLYKDLQTVYPKESEDILAKLQGINEKITRNYEANLVELEYISGTKRSFVLIEKKFTTPAPMQPAYVKEIIPGSIPIALVTPIDPQPIEKADNSFTYKFDSFDSQISIIYMIEASSLALFPDTITILSPASSPSEIELQLLDFDCPNSICNPGEDYLSCPEDCTCGNNICDAGETSESCPRDCAAFPLTAFVITILILVAAVVVALVMKPGFLRKYSFMQKISSRIKSQPLFSSPAEATKIISFVRIARQRKMTDREISSVLEKKGWKSKQIKYALKRAK